MRGASAPEYAIGAGLLAVLLLGGMQAVESAADRRYDDQQAVVGTPVTDLGGTTATTTASTGTTATIPSTTTTTTVATTTSTAGPATTTTTAAVTTTTLPSITFTASAVSTGNNKWHIAYAVTSTAPAGNVTVTWPGGSSPCSLATRSCSGVSAEFNKNQGSRTISATGIAGFAGPTPSSYTLAPPA